MKLSQKKKLLKKRTLNKAQRDFEAVEKENKELDDANEELAKRSSNFEVFERALELYADPANWTDGRFAPVMRYISADEPYEPARTALGG